MVKVPFLSTYDPPGTSEGTLDPLGLYLIADQLATQLVPSVRERMLRIRFLTAATVGAWLTEEIEPNSRYPQLTPYQVWEWLVVEAMVRTMSADEGLWGVPGTLVVKKAIADHDYVDERSYLKTARVFGFHGVYKRLGVHLGLFDTHFRFRAPRGEELLSEWARDQGYNSFDSGQPQFEKWRKAVSTSLSESPVRTRTLPRWTQDDWRELAEAFVPHGLQRREKRCLNRFLLSTEDDNLGAFLVIWNLLNDLGTEQADEFVFHQELRKVAPQYDSLLQGVSAYEQFCRCLTNAFDIIRSSGSQHDVKGLRITSLGHNEDFARLAEQFHVLYVKALQRLGEADPFAESRFIERFARFADHLPPVQFARELCEHHEAVQQAKSREGKRSWFDRISADHIYIRPNFRLKDLESPSDDYVHDYRMKPIQRFYRDLK